MLEFGKKFNLKDASRLFLYIALTVILVPIWMGIVLGFILALLEVDTTTYQIPMYVQMIMQFVLYAAIFLVFFLFYRAKKKKSAQANFSYNADAPALNNPEQVANKNLIINPLYLVIAIVLGVVSLYGFNGIVSMIDYLIESFKPSASFGEMSMAYFAPMLILLCIAPAFIEELIFRGVILGGLKKKFKPSVAIVLSALMFALFHFSIHQFIYQFILGIILAATVHFTGKVLYGMIIHFVNNFIVILYQFFATGSAELPSGFTYEEIIANIIIALIGAAIIIGLLYILFKHRHKEQGDNPPLQESTSQGADYPPVADNLNYSEEPQNTPVLPNTGIDYSPNKYYILMSVIGFIWIVVAVIL